jgi:hypothetical protein
MIRAIFGPVGQFIVGALMLVATGAQTVWWVWFSHPGFLAIFLVSMEALAFASFNQMASALGYRATERVETAVVENIEQADEVVVDSG